MFNKTTLVLNMTMFRTANCQFTLVQFNSVQSQVH